jgi:hypothetical protein
MKSTIRIMLWAAGAAFLGVSPAAAGIGDVVASFPSPADNPTALAWADGNLYCYCQSGPYLFWEIRPTDGQVLRSFKFGENAPYIAGLAHDGKYFWAGNTEEDVIYRFAWGGSVASSFKVNWNYGLGLTWTGLHLWGAEIGTKWSHGYYQMRVDGKVIRTYSSLYELYDLAWDGANIWAGEFDDIAETYRVIGFDPEQGSFVGSFETPAVEPRGATYDGRYFWLSTTADQGRLWKIDIRGVGVEPQSLGRIKTLFR